MHSAISRRRRRSACAPGRRSAVSFWARSAGTGYSGSRCPSGLSGAVLGWLILPQTAATDTRKRFDWNGALLLGPAIVMLVLALNQMTAWGATSPVIIGLVVVAAVLIWLLIRKERNSSSPLVDLRLFASGGFTRGIIAVVLGYALLYGMFFLMSFALEHGYGDTPAAAGLRLAVIPIALGLVAPFSGTLSDRMGERLLSATGMGLCLVALIILAFAEANPDARVRSQRCLRDLRRGARRLHRAQQSRDDKGRARQSFR